MKPEEIAELPPILVAIACGQLSRYTDFAACVNAVQVPPGSGFFWAGAASVADNENDAVRMTLLDPTYEMLWILGDDHTFEPELLATMAARMLEHDLDILVPLCYRRTWPPTSVLYDRVQDGVTKQMPNARVAELMAAGERIVEVLAAGTGGMLIRRRTLEGTPFPWFRNGMTGRDGEQTTQSGEDLNWCHLAREHGFRVHAALDLPFGHITPATFIPDFIEGRLAVRVRFGMVDGPLYAL